MKPVWHLLRSFLKESSSRFFSLPVITLSAFTLSVFVRQVLSLKGLLLRICPGRKSIAALLSTILFLTTSLIPASRVFADTIPPVIQYDESVEIAVAENSPLTLRVDVSDVDGVAGVWLYLRSVNSSEYLKKPMQLQANSKTLYAYEFKRGELVAPTMDYYIEALDGDNNLQSVGFDFDPLKIKVSTSNGATTLAGTESRAGDESVASGNNTLWYILGGLLVAGLVAGASGGSSGGSTESQPFVIQPQ